MKKILLIPLDERPCNYDFPQLLAGDTDYELVVPPREILGKKKQCGNVDAIWSWLLEHIVDCDDAIISIDTLLYSGIVPSRLHYENAETLISKLERLREVRKALPSLNIYAFNLIMRNPTYSSDDEEPDYYGLWGAEIHRWGVITHRKELDIATEDERQELDNINKRLPKEHLKDYLNRRAVNIEVNKKVVELTAEGLFTFSLFPQDDASPYGLTAKDQQLIREKIRHHDVDLNVYMYPDADAAVNTLLARAINNREHKRPLVFVKFASNVGGAVIPDYEDRLVGETIKYHILAAGGLVASCVSEADIVLMINIPSGGMQDRWTEIDSRSELPSTIEYDANRTLIELIEYADYAISQLNKSVVFADIAYCNGGDHLLFRLLRQKDLLWKLAGYAGWNTSSNTIGTCLPMGMIYSIYGCTKAHIDFLALRYLEDIGFSCYVRRDVILEELPRITGLDSQKIDGPRGNVAEIVHNRLQKFADESLSGNHKTVKITDCYMPWSRMFEVGMEVHVHDS
ncbi:MAG: DUF4127 family protein [Oscillospiraceae bacterium]|nr:DUF4127 family protein [Oscillospiraceae bacterium]